MGSAPVLGAALFVVGSALLLVLVGPVADWLTEDVGLPGRARADAVDATRRTLLQGAAGLLAVVALVYTARTYSLSREGQLTDRYTTAVNQLGAEALSQRVGGVYALERVMRESRNDHWAVVEVLAAFIRERGEYPGGDGLRRRGDVQAALTVLGRRPRENRSELDRIRLGHTDLRNTLMRDGRLDNASLRYARLDDSHWENASLVGARCRNAVLRRADFEGAVLRDAGLYKTDLSDVNLKGADLRGADLTDATLTRAHLSGVRGNPVLSEAQEKAVHCLPSVRCEAD